MLCPEKLVPFFFLVSSRRPLVSKQISPLYEKICPIFFLTELFQVKAISDPRLSMNKDTPNAILKDTGAHQSTF
jgi:hypothetical protein